MLQTLLLALLAFAPAQPPAVPAQPPAVPAQPQAPSALPQAAPAAATVPLKPYPFNVRIADELTLPDLAGQSHALFTAHKDKALVLVFWSYKDPVSRFYAAQLAELERANAGKLAIVLVNSNYDELVSGGDALAKLREVVAAEKVTLPLLIDADNRLADDFGATANGQAFLIDANRFLRYHGGIDDDPNGARRKQGLEPRTWLANAVAQVLAGEIPKESWTRPSGRPIKRTPKAEAKDPGNKDPGQNAPAKKP